MQPQLLRTQTLAYCPLYTLQRMGTPAERELQYTTKKIQQNFSNYSAWHYRSWLLPLLANKDEISGDNALPVGSAAALLPHALLVEEYELVSQAFFTEPEDQSGWIYHRWLLGEASAGSRIRGIVLVE